MKIINNIQEFIPRKEYQVGESFMFFGVELKTVKPEIEDTCEGCYIFEKDIEIDCKKYFKCDNCIFEKYENS